MCVSPSSSSFLPSFRQLTVLGLSCPALFQMFWICIFVLQQIQSLSLSLSLLVCVCSLLFFSPTCVNGVAYLNFSSSCLTPSRVQHTVCFRSIYIFAILTVHTVILLVFCMSVCPGRVIPPLLVFPKFLPFFC